MRRGPRGLSADELVLWRKVADTVTPLHPPARRVAAPTPVAALPAANEPASPPPRKLKGRVPPPRPAPPAPAQPPRPLHASGQGLDASWDRKLARGTISPDVSIDLHGLNLDLAHGRLLASLAQALAIGARVILLVTGKPRPHGDHDLRGERRGAIRAKLLDWLAASPYADRIAAVRPAQPRHGGAGAVYIVLRRPR
ncbi:DNA-nicking Smr family endonuclease [Novosphingobium capsulatum]|uniref:DNA-nicking Smr family endonuclease n=2 Tax=Novosphingobium TaxID=165696 RepID=A0ABU1MRE7_9SPHN|nr:Smr/MutS family protein [Novosphingobium capsulatum]MDR6512920.1 DNA-nicking Smr family endonuclease [Novosphingobium capsulatum]